MLVINIHVINRVLVRIVLYYLAKFENAAANCSSDILSTSRARTKNK